MNLSDLPPPPSFFRTVIALGNFFSALFFNNSGVKKLISVLFWAKLDQNCTNDELTNFDK